MANQRRAECELRAVAVESPADASDGGTEELQRTPYLKVSGPDIDVFEFELPDRTSAIGRSPDADIRLPHPSVSRVHAMISYTEGKYTLKDFGSSRGIAVNGQSTKRRVLAHGDRIAITSYVLEFRTRREPAGAASAAVRAKLLLRDEYWMLPSNVQVKYRMLAAVSQEIFKPGDTLRIGRGGLLIPARLSPGDCMCLELDVLWPNQKPERYLGEIVGVILEESTHWMCVKFHSVPQETYNAIVHASGPGPWVLAAS